MTRFAIISLVFIFAMKSGAATFTQQPAISMVDDKTFITFAVSDQIDVEVAIVNASGKVVRHLAAGVIGTSVNSPEPLMAGLTQRIEWNGLDDYGAVATGSPFTARVRLGVALEFEKRISARVYNPSWGLNFFKDTTNVYPDNFGIDSISSTDTLIPMTHPVWRCGKGYYGIPDTFPNGVTKIKFYESKTSFDMTVSDEDDKILIQNDRNLATAAPMALINGVTGQTIQILPPYGQSSSAIATKYYPSPVGAEAPAAMFMYAEPNFDWYGRYFLHDEGGACNHLFRFGLNGEPLPFTSGPNAGYHSIRQTIHTGSDLRQRGIATGPDGSIYHGHSASKFDSLFTKVGGGSWYYVSKYDSNGALINDSLLKIWGNIGQGVRIDLKGNIFAGIRVRPYPDSVPAEIKAQLTGVQTDKYSQRYWATVVYGSIVKFGPGGGVIAPDAAGNLMAGPSMNRARAERMVWMHYGASFQPSHVSYVGATCICYAPRFDVDRYGRVIFPNGFQNEFKALDNNGNLIFRVHNRDLVNKVKIGMIHVVQATDRAVYCADHINNQIICMTWKADEESSLPISTVGVSRLATGDIIITVSSSPNPLTTPVSMIHLNGLRASDLANMSLDIFDARGRKVADLTREVRAGRTSIRWVANDASGGVLPSGVYYLKLTTAANKTIVKSMMLMK
ncbi:MAG: hypothetical protein JNL74_14450 [Fibrobacteres bacterium]|nr:hypothetical protein [Fibrobacterota bacterium]